MAKSKDMQDIIVVDREAEMESQKWKAKYSEKLSVDAAGAKSSKSRHASKLKNFFARSASFDIKSDRDESIYNLFDENSNILDSNNLPPEPKMLIYLDYGRLIESKAD